MSIGVGIIGAGMMGAGIAYVSANAKMEVVLKDISSESGEKGKAYSAKLLKKSETPVSIGISHPASQN